MYYHAFVPVDCSEQARRSVRALARYLATMPVCKVTLVAATTPTASAEMRALKREHAAAALRAMRALLHTFGVYAVGRIVEGEDPIAAMAAETENLDDRFDLVLLTTYQVRPEREDFRCRGSLADQLCGRIHIPALVLPVDPDEPLIALEGFK